MAFTCEFVFFISGLSLWIASGVALAKTVRGKSHCEILQNYKNGVLSLSLRDSATQNRGNPF